MFITIKVKDILSEIFSNILYLSPNHRISDLTTKANRTFLFLNVRFAVIPTVVLFTNISDKIEKHTGDWKIVYIVLFVAAVLILNFGLL